MTASLFGSIEVERQRIRERAVQTLWGVVELTPGTELETGVNVSKAAEEPEVTKKWHYNPAEPRDPHGHWVHIAGELKAMSDAMASETAKSREQGNANSRYMTAGRDLKKASKALAAGDHEQAVTHLDAAVNHMTKATAKSAAGDDVNERAKEIHAEISGEAHVVQRVAQINRDIAEQRAISDRRDAESAAHSMTLRGLQYEHGKAVAEDEAGKLDTPGGYTRTQLDAYGAELSRREDDLSHLNRDQRTVYNAAEAAGKSHADALVAALRSEPATPATTETTARALNFSKTEPGRYHATGASHNYIVQRDGKSWLLSIHAHDPDSPAGLKLSLRDPEVRDSHDDRKIARDTAQEFENLGDGYKQSEHGGRNRYTEAVGRAYEADKQRVLGTPVEAPVAVPAPPNTPEAAARALKLSHEQSAVYLSQRKMGASHEAALHTATHSGLPEVPPKPPKPPVSHSSAREAITRIPPDRVLGNMSHEQLTADINLRRATARSLGIDHEQDVNRALRLMTEVRDRKLAAVSPPATGPHQPGNHVDISLSDAPWQRGTVTANDGKNAKVKLRNGSIVNVPLDKNGESARLRPHVPSTPLPARDDHMRLHLLQQHGVEDNSTLMSQLRATHRSLHEQGAGHTHPGVLDEPEAGPGSRADRESSALPPDQRAKYRDAMLRGATHDEAMSQARDTGKQTPESGARNVAEVTAPAHPQPRIPGVDTRPEEVRGIQRQIHAMSGTAAGWTPQEVVQRDAANVNAQLNSGAKRITTRVPKGGEISMSPATAQHLLTAQTPPRPPHWERMATGEASAPDTPGTTLHLTPRGAPAEPTTPVEQHKFTGPGGTQEPGNAADLRAFRALSPEQQAHVSTRAAELYDGSRTIARAWKEALAERQPAPIAEKIPSGGNVSVPERVAGSDVVKPVSKKVNVPGLPAGYSLHDTGERRQDVNVKSDLKSYDLYHGNRKVGSVKQEVKSTPRGVQGNVAYGGFSHRKVNDWDVTDPEVRRNVQNAVSDFAQQQARLRGRGERNVNDAAVNVARAHQVGQLTADQQSAYYKASSWAGGNQSHENALATALGKSLSQQIPHWGTGELPAF